MHSGYGSINWLDDYMLKPVTFDAQSEAVGNKLGKRLGWTA